MTTIRKTINKCWAIASILVLCAVSSKAQNASPLGGVGNLQFFDNSGVPLISGVVYVYNAGTTTQASVYVDGTGTTLQPNPVTFGTGARSSIWLANGTFVKVVLCLQNDGPFCAAGDILFSADQVPIGASSSGSGSSPFTGIFISSTASPATSGILRLASGDSVCFRNAAGSTNLCLNKDSTDLLTWAGGSLKLPEVGAPAGQVGFDILWADNTAHRLKAVNNGATVVQYVLSGNDIGTTDQVSGVHFGATQQTFGGTAPTTGQYLQFNGTNIVGGPLIVLNKQDTQGSATTGNGTAQTVFTYTMPSGTLGSGKCLNIYAIIQKVTGANTLQPGITFGATTVLLGPSNPVNAGFELYGKVCNNNGSTIAQWGGAHGIGGATVVQASFSSPAENTGSNSVIITVTANVAAPDTWKGIGFTVTTDP